MEEIFEEANEHLRSLRVDEALRVYDLAEKTGYDADACAAGRWTCHMLQGNFELAWRESDEIARRGQPDPHRFWDGCPLDGRSVLLRCLHGLGDTLQFIRYAPLIRQRARSFAVEVQPRLKPLLIESGVAERVFTWGEPEPFWDQQIEVIELPRIFRTTLESIPNGVPYLDVLAPTIAPRDGLRPLRVGFVWSASDYNPERSIPIECFARLFSTPGVAFFSLQAGEEGGEVGPWLNQTVSVSEDAASVLGTAKALKGLDLLITVDTMLAHLAGALATAGLDAFAVPVRLALDAGSGGFALVSDHAPLPAAHTRRLEAGNRLRAD